MMPRFMSYTKVRPNLTSVEVIMLLGSRLGTVPPASHFVVGVEFIALQDNQTKHKLRSHRPLQFESSDEKGNRNIGIS